MMSTILHEYYILYIVGGFYWHCQHSIIGQTVSIIRQCLMRSIRYACGRNGVSNRVAEYPLAIPTSSVAAHPTIYKTDCESAR